MTAVNDEMFSFEPCAFSIRIMSSDVVAHPTSESVVKTASIGNANPKPKRDPETVARVALEVVVLFFIVAIISFGSLPNAGSKREHW
jgi:hypothetical protein